MHTDIPTHKNIGALLRVYEHDTDKVSAAVAQTKEAVRVLRSLSPAPSIDVMVWTDRSRYAAKSDCGSTAEALRLSLGDQDVRVVEFASGDIFVDILNAGVASHRDRGCDRSLILSPQAASYLTQDAWERMLDAADRGAKAAGVAVAEAGPTIHDGCLANTLCLWDTDALLGVGGFDGASRMPADGEADRPSGVEEIIPLFRLVETYGPCIAVIPPSNKDASYVIPDAAADPQEYTRNKEKFASKKKRQAYMLATIGAGFAQLKQGLMSA